MLEVKYFYEKTDQEYETYNNLWNENKERFIDLQTDLPLREQRKSIVEQLNINKDILAIRFPYMGELKKSKIIDDILLGNGFKYDHNKVWYPKEIWIYSPFK